MLRLFSLVGLELGGCRAGLGPTTVGLGAPSASDGGTPPTPEPGGGGANACPSAEEEVHTNPDLHHQQTSK